MRIWIWRLPRDLPSHEVESVPLFGWAGPEERAFEVLLTMDSNTHFQQNISNYRIAVIAIEAPSNGLADTKPLMPKVMALLPSVRPGTVTIVR